MEENDLSVPRDVAIFSDGVTVSLITPDGVERRATQELPALLADPANLVWVDLPGCAVGDAERLREIFGFHPLALRDSVERNHISKLHVYADHVFFALHSPEIGPHGHVHYVELDQFIGRNSLVTVHGPYASAGGSGDGVAGHRVRAAAHRRGQQSTRSHRSTSPPRSSPP